MKRYLLLAGICLLAIAFLGLPPGSYTRMWRSNRPKTTPQREEFLHIRSRLRLEVWLHQRTQWRDSIRTVLGRLNPAETPFLAVLPPGSPDTLLARLEGAIRDHLIEIGDRPPRVPVGVFFMEKDALAHPEAPRGLGGDFMAQREIMAGREGEPPFCAVIEPVPGPDPVGLAATLNRLIVQRRGTSSRPNTLRICGFFARYGPPGPHLAEWLRKGGGVFGTGADFFRYDQRTGGLPPPRQAFGRSFFRYFGSSERGLACLGGVEASCREIFFSRWTSGAYFQPRGFQEYYQDARSPVDFFGNRWYFSGHFGGLDQFLFQELEAEFGTDRFSRFWTSEFPAEDAFRQAFGLPASSWIMGWAQGHFGSIHRGPGVPVQAGVLTFLTVGLLGGAALLAGGRRR